MKRLVLIATTLSLVAEAFAAISTWNGGGTDNKWTKAGNWGGTAPVANDTLQFGGTVEPSTDNDFAAGTRFNGIVFLDTANTNFTLSGNSIALGGNIVVSNNASGTFTHTINNNIGLGAGYSFDPYGDETLAIDGVLSGTGSVGKAGLSEGTLVLAGNNTYSGGTALSGGVLRLEHNHALGTGAVMVQDIHYSPWVELVDGVAIGNAATFGPAGTQKGLRLESGTGISAEYSGSILVKETDANNFELDANSTGGDNDQTQIFTISGSITSTNGAGVELTGDGVVNLTGANDITNEIKLTRKGAILRLGSNGALGNATVRMAQLGRVQLTNGVNTTGGSLLVMNNYGIKTIEIKNLQTVTAESATFNGNIVLEETDAGAFEVSATDIDTLVLAGIISGISTVDLLGAGTKVFSSNSTYSGATTLQAGTLEINGDNSAATNTVTVTSGATLAGSGTLGGAVTVENGGTLAPGSGGVATLAATNDVTFESGSTYAVEVTPSGTVCDKLDVGGTLTLGGATLDIGTIDGAGRTIAFADTLVGEFDGLADEAVVQAGTPIYYIHYVTNQTPNCITINQTGPTSSGIDLRAYQAAEGTYVEFVAYDVEEDGSIRLALLGENGAVLWSGVVDVVAGPRSVARLLVPGLEAGGTYNFAVTDEVGQGWSAPGVVVGTFETKMVGMSLVGTTLSFDSLPGREYEIQWVPEIGSPWQTVKTVVAEGNQTREAVAYPDPAAPCGFFRVRLK